MKIRLLFSIAFLAFALTPSPLWAQEQAASYRLFGSAGLAQADNQSAFAVGGGLERIWASGAAVSTKFNFVGHPLGESSQAVISPGFAWYFSQGGKTEVFAFGKYESDVSEGDSFTAGGGANLFLFPRYQNLGLRIELGDNVTFAESDQAVVLKTGIIFRF